MPGIVADAQMRALGQSQNCDTADREKGAFDQAWEMLRLELKEFNDAEILSIRSFLAQSILEEAELGETDSALLGVKALKKLSAYLRSGVSARFDAVS